MRLYLLALVPFLASPTPAQRGPGLADATVLVIRHAEKPPTGTDLTLQGVLRANSYPRYFGRYQVNGKPIHIDTIIATKDSKSSFRERLTVEPLAHRLGLPIDMRFANKEYDDLANELKAKPHGKTILICWHHGKIPDLLASLGAEPAKLLPGGKWPDTSFDMVMELSYDHSGHLSKETRIYEHLLPNDHAE